MKYHFDESGNRFQEINSIDELINKSFCTIVIDSIDEIDKNDENPDHQSNQSQSYRIISEFIH
jgi:Ran GTPase-activating protein (RanGAP) involved in mRNA processing and transport